MIIVQESINNERNEICMKTPEIKISQCMIVKNEEKYMEQALSWGKSIMFEQIVVDTGSTDRTVEIAESRGAKVYHYIWEDDFSAAKNYAIGKATGDWIAFMDADEWMTPEDTAKIVPLLETIHRDRSIDALLMQCVHLDEDGTIIGTSTLHRLFRNDRKIRYKNRIHEALHRDAKGGLRSKDVQHELAVMHAYGDGGVERQKVKGARNARILEKELEADPKDALRIMYLGDAFSMAQEEEKAIDTYRRILNEPGLNIPHEVVVQRAGFEIMSRLLHDEEAEDEFFHVAEQLKKAGGDEHPDLYYLPGCRCVLMDDYQKAAEYFEKAIARLETYRGMETVRLGTNLTLACCVIAKAALEQKDLQKAVQHAVLTLQGSKYHDEAIVILLQAFREEWKSTSDVDAYINFLRQFYDLQSADDRAFLRDAAERAEFKVLGKAL